MVSTDLQKAIDHLQQGSWKLVVVKSGLIVFSQGGKGIVPLLHLYEQNREQAAGSAVADRVVGKAAALLYKELRVKAVYGGLCSVSAIQYLKQQGVRVKAGIIVPEILSIDKKHLCPMETIAQGCSDGNQFYVKAKNFLSNLPKPEHN